MGKKNVNTPSYWDKKWREHHVVYANDPRRDALYQRILQSIPPASRILDVGGGCSRFSHLAREQGHFPFVVDISPWAVEYLAQDGIPGAAYDVNQWTVEEEPFGEFDVGVCTECLEHLERPGAALTLIGWHVDHAFFSVPTNNDGPDAHEHLRLYTPESFKEYLAWYFGGKIEVEMVGKYIFAEASCIWSTYSPRSERKVKSNV